MQADASWGPWTGNVGTAATFIFRLGGDGEGSERFDPNAAANEYYQYAYPDSWPGWSYGSDLYMGSGALGASALCIQSTYTAATNQVCGGESNWGATDMVVLGR